MKYLKRFSAWFFCKLQIVTHFPTQMSNKRGIKRKRLKDRISKLNILCSTSRRKRSPYGSPVQLSAVFFSKNVQLCMNWMHRSKTTDEDCITNHPPSVFDVRLSKTIMDGQLRGGHEIVFVFSFLCPKT